MIPLKDLQELKDQQDLLEIKDLLHLLDLKVLKVPKVIKVLKDPLVLHQRDRRVLKVVHRRVTKVEVETKDRVVLQVILHKVV